MYRRRQTHATLPGRASFYTNLPESRQSFGKGSVVVEMNRTTRANCNLQKMQTRGAGCVPEAGFILDSKRSTEFKIREEIAGALQILEYHSLFFPE